MKTTVLLCSHPGCEAEALVTMPAEGPPVCKAHDPLPPAPPEVHSFRAHTDAQAAEARGRILADKLTAVLQRPEYDRLRRYRRPWLGYLDGRQVGIGTTEAAVLWAIADAKAERERRDVEK